MTTENMKDYAQKCDKIVENAQRLADHLKKIANKMKDVYNQNVTEGVDRKTQGQLDSLKEARKILDDSYKLNIGMLVNSYKTLSELFDDQIDFVKETQDALKGL